MKRVLLIGDSIRLNYCPVVFMKLDGLAEVVYPEDNCRFAKYTLCEFNHWLDLYGKPDLIHWNNGLWDVSHFDKDILTPLDEYLREMERIYNKMAATGAEIIFATTTPTSPLDGSRSQTNIQRYNNAICRFMEEKGVEINDLYSLVKPHVEEYICEDHVHLNKYGIRAVGNHVAEVIKKHL